MPTTAPERYAGGASSAENPIERLAARLQRLPAGIRWLYAQDVIRTTALGQAPERGPWSRRADRLVALSSRLGLARISAAVVNALLLTAICVRQRMVRCKPASAALFVGIKALREPELVRQFEKMVGKPVLHLDERGLNDFFRLVHVPVPVALREMWSVWSEVWAQLDPSLPAEGIDRSYLLVFFLMRGHEFAYLRAWFRRYLSQPGAARTIACTTASHVAFAGVAAGAEVVHMEHGFQRRSLIYPDFAQSLCFNGFDAEHLRRRLPQCAASVVVEPQALATRRVAAVAGSYFAPDGFDLIRPFIDWALSNDLPVIVRKHPADASAYWEQWRGVAGVEITDGGGSFANFLDTFRPRILTSWISTALFDAIVRGIVPIVVAPTDNEAAIDTVFPLRELSLCWPEHEKIAQKLLNDDGLRAQFVAENYARAMGMDDSALLSDAPWLKQAKPALA